MLDNAAIAELLIREAQTASEHRRLAFKRAARAAFKWPEEAAHLAAEGRSLTELEGKVAQTGWQFDLRSTQDKLVVSLMTALAEV